jgi:hypothetical protein
MNRRISGEIDRKYGRILFCDQHDLTERSPREEPISRLPEKLITYCGALVYDHLGLTGRSPRVYYCNDRPGDRCLSVFSELSADVACLYSVHSPAPDLSK